MTDQEIRALIVQNRHDLQTVLTAFDSALTELSAWVAQPDQTPNASQIQHLREVILGGYARSRVLEGQYQTLRAQLDRLLALPDAMKSTYIRGYDDRLLELKAQAIGEEYAQLCRLLQRFYPDQALPF